MPFMAEEYTQSIDDNHEVINLGRLAAWVYPRVFRENVQAPGFSLVILPPWVDSFTLRKMMVGLKQKLSGFSRRFLNAELCYRSLGRFNQQTTTRFHLDGGPERSYLMLGYEPTPVASEIAMADLTKAALDLQITPADYLERYNPMLPVHEARLQNYITRLTTFDPNRPQILCINNSRQGFHAGDGHQLGVFHQATISCPRQDTARIVNSTMITLCSDLAREAVPERQQSEFLETTRVADNNYQ